MSQAAVSRTIAEVLRDCQKTFASHKRGIKTLKKIQKSDPETFAKQFIPLINRLLIIFKREPSVERLIQFIVSFATSPSNVTDTTEENTSGNVGNGDDFDFALLLLSYLLEYTNVKEKAVRFRTCQLVAGIINSLSESAEIEDDLWEELSKKMIDRTRDKIPIIRSQAVAALSRLQNPLDSSDEVISQYLALLSNDSSVEVRKTILSYIGISKVTLPHVLKRTRDVKEEVRRQAFSILSKKVNVKVLSISQRISLLHQGLNDRSSKVQSACVEMIINGWLPSLNNNIIQLLLKLDIEENSNEITLEKMFDSILPLLLLNDSISSSIPKVSLLFHQVTERARNEDFKNLLSSEDLFFWRILLSFFFKSKQNFSHLSLDDFLPEISEIVYLLKLYNEKGTISESSQYIIKQLLLICKFLDFSDEAGRRSLETYLREMILSVESEENLEIILDVISSVSGGKEAHFSGMLLELIADLKDPLTGGELEESISNIQIEEEQEEETGKYSQEIIALKKQILLIQKKVATLIPKEISEETLIDNLSPEIQELYLEAQEKQKEIVEYQKKQQEEIKKEISESTWIRCLTITHFLLANTTIGIRDAGIAGCLNDLILPAIQQSNEEVRYLAVKCLGLYSILLLQSSDDTKKQEDSISILIRAFHVDTPKIKHAALEALFDIMLILGRILHSLTSTVENSSTIEESYQSQVNLVIQLVEEIIIKYIDLDSILRTQLKKFPKSNKKKGKSSVKDVELEFSQELENEMKISVIAVQGFAKLVFNDVCHVFYSPAKVLGKLLILFFGTGAKWTDPSDENEEESDEITSENGEENSIKHKETKETIKQCLSIFFPSYSFSSIHHQKNIENIMLSTIENIYNNSNSSSIHLLTSQLLNICKFIFFLTNPLSCSNSQISSSSIQNSGNPLHDQIMSSENIHGRIIVRILHRILIKPKGEGKLLCKVLGGNLSILHLKKLHKSLIDYIQSLLSECQKEVVDKLCLKALQKFNQSIPNSPSASVDEDFSSPIFTLDQINSFFRELEKQEGAITHSLPFVASLVSIPLLKAKSKPQTSRKLNTKKIKEESSESSEEDSLSEGILDSESSSEEESEEQSSSKSESEDELKVKEEEKEKNSPIKVQVVKEKHIIPSKATQVINKPTESRKSDEIQKSVQNTQKRESDSSQDIINHIKNVSKDKPKAISAHVKSKETSPSLTVTKPKTSKPSLQESLGIKTSTNADKKVPSKTTTTVSKPATKPEVPTAKPAPKKTTNPIPKPTSKVSPTTSNTQPKPNPVKTITDPKKKPSTVDPNKENKQTNKEKARIKKELEVKQELEELDNLLDSDIPSTPPSKQKATKKIMDEIDSLLDL